MAGLQKSLPYIAEIDEPAFVEPALHIAATGDLNPHWFGHPGATIIYPLALLIRLGAAVSLLGPGDLLAHYATNIQPFYLLGRFESIAYEVMAIPLVFLVGRAAFGQTAALGGAWLTAIVPIAAAHAQVVRDDSAGVFFGMLSLWLCVRVCKRTTRTAVVIAGLSIGLAIATRYFMVALVPVLLAGVVISQHRPAWRTQLLALACVGLGFAYASPFALIDLRALRASLGSEAEQSHLGADGLSPPGNLVWYLTQALPADLTWPVAILAVVGIVCILRRGQPAQVLLVAYVAVFLTLISASALHWHRWTIQTLPVLALCGGYALQLGTQRFRLPRLMPLLVLGVASVQAACQLLLWDLQQAQTSPQVVGRQWMIDNLPIGASVVEEWYSPPLEGSTIRFHLQFSLSEQPLEHYALSGSPVIVAASAIYNRYFAEPQRYAGQVRFYERLFTKGQLLQEFQVTVAGADQLRLLGGDECNCSLSPTRGAAVIRVYRVATE